jgi:hypothetical protein
VKVRVRVVLLLAGIAALVLVLQIAGVPEDTKFWTAVYDFGHGPLFGLMALLFLQLFRLGRNGGDRGSAAPYFLAFGAAVLVGALAEAAQFRSPRDADPLDALRNAAGAAAFLAGHAALDGRRQKGPARSRRTRGVLIVTAVLLMGALAVPLVAVGLDYRRRNAALPVLMDMDATWAPRFQDLVSSTLRPADATAGWSTDARPSRLLLSRARFPRFEIEEPYPDWTAYRKLRFEVFSTQAEPVAVFVRIHDARHSGDSEDRFRQRMMLAPGVNRIELALEDIENAPRDREMDMRRVRSVMLFADQPAEPIELYLGDFRLVR